MRFRLSLALYVCLIPLAWSLAKGVRAQEQAKNSLPANPLVVQAGPRGEVRALAISPDRTRLATLSAANVQVWTHGGTVVWSRLVAGDPRALAWSQDGTRVAVGIGGTEGFYVGKSGDSAGVLELDARDGHVTRTLLAGNNTVYHLAYLMDGRLQVVSGEGTVMWDINGVKIGPKEEEERSTGTIYPSPDGSKLAVLGEGVQIWDGSLTHKVASLWQKGIPTQALTWAPDGQSLAVSDGKQVQVWDVATRQIKRVYTPSSRLKAALPTSSDAFDVAFAQQGDAIFYIRTDFPNSKEDSDGNVELGHPRSFAWRLDITSGKEQILCEGVRGALLKIALWPDGVLVLGGAENNTPDQWEGEMRFARVDNSLLKAIWQAPQSLNSIRRVQLSPDGTLLAVGGEDTAIRLWNVTTGRLQKTLKTLSSSILALDFSPSGRQIAALDYESLFLFNVQTGVVRQFPGVEVYDLDSMSVSWSPDEKQIAYGGGSGSFVLDTITGKRRELHLAAAKTEDDSERSVFGPLLWTKEGLDVSGGLMRINPQSGQVLRSLDATGVASERNHEGGVAHFQFFDSGRHLFSLGGDEREAVTVKRWDVTKNRIERTIEDLNDAHTLALTPDENTLAVGTRGGEVRLYDARTLALQWRRATGASTGDLAWSANGDRLFVGGDDGQMRVFDERGELQNTLIALPALKARSTGYEWINLAADGRYLASDKANAQLRWRAGASLQALPTQSRATTALPISQSTKRIVQVERSSSNIAVPTSGSVPTFGAPRQTKPRFPTLVIQGLKASAVSSLAISNDSRWIVSGNSGGNLTLWDGKNTLEWGDLVSPSDQVPLFFSPDGKLLFSSRANYGGGDAHSIEIRRVPEGKLLRKIPLLAQPLWSDGKTLRGVESGHVLAFDVANGKRLWSRPLASLLPTARLQFSPDGALLVSGGDSGKDHTARIWRVADGKPILAIKDPLRVIGMAAVSSDGRFLATEGDDPNWSPPNDAASEAAYARTFNIHLWSVRTKKLLATFPGYYSLEGGARLLRFSPDGKWLLSAGSGGGLARFDMTSHRLIQVPATPKDDVSPIDTPLAVSRDGATMVAKTRKGGLQVFDVIHNRAGRAFAGPLSSISVTWSPDGEYLLSETALSLFDAKSGVLLHQARDSYVRDLVWGENEIQTASLETVTRWKIPSLEKISTWRIGPGTEEDPTGGYSDGVRLSPDGGTVLTTDPKGPFRGGGKGLFVWDAHTHKLRRTMIPDMEHGYTSLDNLVFFPGGDKILRGTNSGCQAWDLTTGELIRTWRDPVAPDYTASTSGFDDALRPLAVSGDRQLVALRATRDQSIWIFAMQGDAAPLHLLVKAGYHAHFLRDNRTLVCDGSKGLEWWDARGDGQLAMRIWLGTSAAIFSPDEKLASVVTPAGPSIWSVPQNGPALSLYLLGSTQPYDSNKTLQDWIALTPEGFYNASPLGEERLRWHDTNAFWSLAQSRARFKNADAVQAALGG